MIRSFDISCSQIVKYRSLNLFDDDVGSELIEWI